MPNLLQVVVSLGQVFDGLQIPFAIGGAIANNYWGVVRTTQDIDCLISVPAIKYQALADALNNLGCTIANDNQQQVPVSVPELLKQAKTRKLIECFKDRIRIEMFVPAVPLQEEILRRAISIPIGDQQIRITTAEDLILLKLAFHRIKDLQDVRGIAWLQRGKLDINYLRHWSARTHDSEVQVELEQLIRDYSDGQPDGEVR